MGNTSRSTSSMSCTKAAQKHDHPATRPDEVFLGGSCNPTTWRHRLAIPTLTANAVSYYNPQVEEWSPELLGLEEQAKQRAAVLLFVIDGDTRAIFSMLEALQYVTEGRKVALAVIDVEEGQAIDGIQVGVREMKDLNRARVYLKETAARKGVEVRDTAEAAIQDAVNLAIQARIQARALQPKQTSDVSSRCCAVEGAVGVEGRGAKAECEAKCRSPKMSFEAMAMEEEAGSKKLDLELVPARRAPFFKRTRSLI